MYPQGTTLKLDFGTFYHYGIADGQGGVIHNSKKHMMVTHESEADFSEGKPILISEITNNNLSHALYKAKSFIGMPYNLIKSNCEHFVRLCHGLEIESKQIQKYLLVSVTTGIAYKSSQPIVRIASGAASLAALFTSREENPFSNAAMAALIATGLYLAIS